MGHRPRPDVLPDVECQIRPDTEDLRVGLERRTVLLWVNEAAATDRACERLYVGMPRATDQLVVVGDPEVVRGMSDEEIARRLEI